jgi:predicted PurR-regulated permease PerM
MERTTPNPAGDADLVRAQRLKWPRWLPILVAGLVALFLFGLVVEGLHGLGRFLWPIFIPLLISAVLAYILDPVVLWCERKGLSRRQAIIATLLGVVVLIALVVIFLVPAVVAQLTVSAERLPEVLGGLVAALEPELLRLRSINEHLYLRAHGSLTEFAQNPGRAVDPVIEFLDSGVGGFFGLTTTVFDSILVPFFVYYILLDLPKLRRNVELMIPPRYRSSVHEVFDRVTEVGSNFVRGQILISSYMAGIYTVGFLLLGVPLAVALGIVSGFSLFIPYVGPIMAAVATALITLLDSPEWWRVAAVLGLFIVFQSLEGLVITPYILGERLRLHPFLVLAGITIGGHLFGILGMILATPTIAAARVVISYGYHTYLHSKFYKGPAVEIGALNLAPAPAQTPRDAYAEVSQMADDEKVSPVTGGPVSG